MAQQQSPWLEGAYGWNFGEGGWNTGMDQNLLKFSFLFDRNVDGIVGSLPAAINGQAYFLNTDNRLYFAVDTTWFSSPVPKWFEFKDRSTGNMYQFNGTSVALIDSPAQIDSRLDAIELTVSSLGTAAFEDVSFFATQAELEIVEATSAAYTDIFKSDLANEVEALKGANLVGYRNRTLKERLDDISFTPEDFGAVGDGIADDTSAFSALHTALVAAGGGYVVMGGTYNVPLGWHITQGNVTLDGQGRGTLNGLGAPNQDALRFTNVSRVTVKDLKVTTPRANFRDGGFCVLFIESDSIVVENTRTDGGAVGIWTINCEDVLVTGCYIDTPKADGIHFGHGSKRCKAIGNTVVNSGDDAFSTTFYTGYTRPTDIVFANNVVRGTIWGAGVSVYSADRVVVSGNNISNTAIFGINLAEHDSGGKPADCIVVGNQIHGACQAETVPESYWFGTSPGLDPAVTSELQKSAITVEGTDIKVSDNLVSQVNSVPNSLRRQGLILNGTVRASITDNTFNDINGDGVKTTSDLNTSLIISGNTFESVLGVGIRVTSTADVSLAICNNSGGYGATLSGEPYLVFLQNAGAVLSLVINNSSSGGRGVFLDGSSTNVTSINNISGAQSFIPFTPTITASSGTLTSASAVGYYYIHGKLLFFKVRGSIVTNGTGADAILFGALPVTAKTGQLAAVCSGRESSIGGLSLTGVINAASSTITVRTYNNGYPGGNGATLELSGYYEIS